MSANLIDDQQLKIMSKFLDLQAYRQSLLSSNIANLDTPGYRTKDVDFKSELQRAVNGTETPFAAAAKEVPGLSERPDGNNVSLDREAMLLSETQLQFRIGVQLMKDKLHRISMAINDGRIQSS